MNEDQKKDRLDRLKNVLKPMDDSVRESRVAEQAVNRQRVCYAAKTLVDEIETMFPETPVEYSNYDGRNTALDVTFDFTGIKPDADRVDLLHLMSLLAGDHRVAEVIADEETVLVSFKSSPRTQDSRESFDLANAWLALTGTDEGYDIDADEAEGWPDGGLNDEGGSL